MSSSPTEHPDLPIATAEIQGTSTTRSSASRSSRAGSRSATNSRSASKLRPPRFAPASTRTSGTHGRGGFYVVGLDGDKRPIDSLTSNIGHLLWSRDRSRTSARGSSPTSSSPTGSSRAGASAPSPATIAATTRSATTPEPIWPHDNAILVLGLARTGFRDAANRIAIAQLDAASFSRHRLPEAFAGFERSISRFPVPYPTACSPQAGQPVRRWSSSRRARVSRAATAKCGSTRRCPRTLAASSSAACTRSAGLGHRGQRELGQDRAGELGAWVANGNGRNFFPTQGPKSGTTRGRRPTRDRFRVRSRDGVS